jgi:site-specific recombinase XerD
MNDLVIDPPAPLARLDQHPVAVYLSRLAPGSRRSTAAALERVARIVSAGATAATLPWHLLRYQHTQAVRAVLAERYSPASANRDLAALRQVLRECRRLGLMSSEDEAATSDLGTVRGTRLPRGRALAQAEVAALFAACDPATPGGVRDAALLALLYGAGLRRQEVARLDLAHLDPVSGALAVMGKGGKQRLVPVGGGARRAIEAWLVVRGREPGPLLLPIAHGAVVRRAAHLSGDAIYAAVLRVAGRAGVAALSPHDCRRTYVGDLLDAGADLATVQALAGHADPATTARYDRRGGATRQRAADLLVVPGAGGGG